MTPQQPPPWLTQTLQQAAALASVPGLQADSILCVRRLHTRLDTQRLRHAGGLLASADQLSRQLRRHASAAARPAHGGVSAEAPAVLFDDPAEMLACAARDWLDGCFGAQWWWQSLLASGALTRGAVALWQRHPAHMPAALASLNARAGEFAGRLGAADAEQLGKLLIDLHALPASRPIQPDWMPQLPGLAADDPRQRFLTLGLLLAHAPGLARLAQAAQVGEAGGPVETNADSAAAAVVSGQSRHAPAPMQVDTAASLRPGMTPVEASAKSEGLDPGLRRGDGVFHRAELGRQGGNTELPPATPIQPRPQETAPSWAAPANPPAGLRQAVPNAAPRSTTHDARLPSFADEAAPVPPPYAAYPARIETRYGGVLYLLNLALHLDFYADFAHPRSPGLALSPWDFLALLGERLAGRALRNDALWPLLCSLAGEDETGPDASARQFIAAPPLPAALHLYLRPPVGTNSFAHPAPTTWAAWLRQLLPPLRRRLAAALGVPARQIGGVLCRQPARIRVAPGRLEVYFSLNAHPLCIRLAGLDRDPGWIPAAGREVRFFYD